MNILLDTHALLWHLADDSRLSLAQSELIKSPQNHKFLSIVSLWEIAIKASTGKLTIAQPLDKLVPAEITILPLEIQHLVEVRRLPFHHRDPFDRAIIAQALVENMPLLSIDTQFAAYGLTLL